MFYKIENEFFTCEVDDLGAQLLSLKSKADDYEYVWYGKPEIWYGQAPVLFPVVGQVRNDTFTYEGKEYFMPKHGLARKLPFTLKSKTESSVAFSLKSDENTLKQYPFDFEFIMEYSLEGNRLKASHKVINNGKDVMYFSLGAHPGFNCSVGDTIEFEKPETVMTERIDSKNLVKDEKYPFLDNEKEFTITKEIFEPDALILTGLNSEKLTLKMKDRKMEFVFGKAPFLGIWAKPGAPYVCIEPWYGVNDGQKDYGDFSNKREIQKLNAGETFEYIWTAGPVD